MGSPVGPLSQFTADMGVFPLRQNFPQFVSVLYPFIWLLAFFIFQSTIYGKKIRFPINNQSDHILEGEKNRSRKLLKKKLACAEHWASMISFFLPINLLAYFCTQTAVSQEEFLNARVQSALPLLRHAAGMPRAFWSYPQDLVYSRVREETS